METTFRFNASALDIKFVTALKTLFKTRDIEITVTDVPNDETTFLLGNPENKAHLLEAIDEVKRNKNLVRFTGEEFKKYNNTLLAK